MNRVTLRTVLFAALALGLAACAGTPKAVSGVYKPGEAFSVTLNREWSDISTIMAGRPKKVKLLSIDGPLLNRFYITDGLAPGDFLVKPEKKERPTPTYRKGMSATELVEFITDSVLALDYERAEALNIRPGQFGAAPGLRFDLAAKTKEGLDLSGAALVAEHGGKLHVMLYLAPSEHYYAANLPAVEAAFASATLAR